MRELMMRAWEIYRTLTGDKAAKLSMALKMAWSEAKASKIATLENVDVDSIEVPEGTILKANRWTKGDKDRLYINLLWRTSRESRKFSFGYFEVIKGKLVFIEDRSGQSYTANTTRNVLEKLHKIA